MMSMLGVCGQVLVPAAAVSGQIPLGKNQEQATFEREAEPCA